MDTIINVDISIVEAMSTTELKAVTGLIFNVQHYTIHDGPGKRTTVFTKGCPLRCMWCQNPESLHAYPEIMLIQDKCTACGRSINVCSQNGIEIRDGHSILANKDVCISCGNCADRCLNEARSLMGKAVTAKEIVDAVSRDLAFYRRSKGGVTLSGGEAMLQPVFVYAVFKLCKAKGIHTALDTSGYTKWENLNAVLKYTDLVLFDIKYFDSDVHFNCTGVHNELILDNLKKPMKQGLQFGFEFP